MKRIANWLMNLHKGSLVAIQQGNKRLVATVTEATKDRIFVREYPGFFHRTNGQHVVCYYERAQLVPASCRN